MYYYIVDPQKINQRQYERVQNLLYSSLSSYRVSGEIVRATGLRTINQLVENAFAHGAKTIVAVGSDDTLHDVINAIKGREMIVGFIPIVDSEIGEILGVGSIESAAKTLGSRRIEEMDLGKVNENYFLSTLTFGLGQEASLGPSILNFNLLKSLFNLPKFEVKFSADASYKATVSVIGGIVVNCSINETNPTDGIADVKLLPKLSKLKTFQYRNAILSGKYEKIPEASIIHINKLEILTTEGLPLKASSKVIAKTPATIEILPKALKIIVGRDRKF